MQKIAIVIFIFTSALFLRQVKVTKRGLSQKEPKQVQQYNLKKGVSISGHDPVTYITERKASRGRKEFSTTYKGVIYQFYSQANKMCFSKTTKFEPQYGGYCAYAIAAINKKAVISPKFFKNRDEKRYLFCDAFGTNTLELWTGEDSKKLQKKTVTNWHKIVQM